MKPVLLKEVLPEVANELEILLRNDNFNYLAEQVSIMLIFDKCRCKDSFCSSFYTAIKPEGGWGPSHENIVLNPQEGEIILDVVDGKIVYVEVLDRDDIHLSLNKAVP